MQQLYSKMSQEEHRKKAAVCVMKLKKQQTIFMKQLTLHDSSTEVSFMVAYNLTKNKPFPDGGEFVKQCMGAQLSTI